MENCNKDETFRNMTEKVNENYAEAPEKDQSKAIDLIYSQIQWVQKCVQTNTKYVWQTGISQDTAG